MKFMKMYSIYKFHILILLNALSKVKIMRSGVDLKFFARTLRKSIWITLNKNPNSSRCDLHCENLDFVGIG